MQSAARLQPVPRSSVVVACALGNQPRFRLIDALRGRGSLRIIDSFEELDGVLRGSPEHVDIAVLPVRDGEGRDATGVIRGLHARWPRLGIVVWCELATDLPAQIRVLSLAGVHQFVFAGIDDAGVALRAVLKAARRQVGSEWLMTRLAPIIPAELHPLVEHVLANPDTVTSPQALAAALGVHRKTVFNRCERAGMLTPGQLITWCRLAMVAYMLEMTGHTLERIAIELGFASDTALRNMLKRYTGYRASQIRDQGGVSLILGALAARMRACPGPMRPGRMPALHAV